MPIKLQESRPSADVSHHPLPEALASRQAAKDDRAVDGLMKVKTSASTPVGSTPIHTIEDVAAPGTPKPPDIDKQTAGWTRPRSTSMLDIRAAQDMVEFGDAVDGLSTSDRRAAMEGKQDDGGGFFIDIEEASDEDSGEESEEDSEEASSGPEDDGSFGGLRHVYSDTSLSSSPSHQRLRALCDLHDIHEHAAVKEAGDEKGDVQPPEKSLNNNNTHPGSGEDAEVASEVCEVAGEDDGPPPALVGVPIWPAGAVAPGNETSLRRGSSGGIPARSSLRGSRSRAGSDGDRPAIHRRSVSFSSLEIRSYGLTIGDAPTKYGPPVQLDWAYDPEATESHGIIEYEGYRTVEAPRRTKQEMLMPATHRQYLLMREAGFSQREIKNATEEARKAAKRRQRTAKMAHMGLGPFEEALETTRRKFGKVGGVGKRLSIRP